MNLTTDPPWITIYLSTIYFLRFFLSKKKKTRHNNFVYHSGTDLYVLTSLIFYLIQNLYNVYVTYLCRATSLGPPPLVPRLPLCLDLYSSL